MTEQLLLLFIQEKRIEEEAARTVSLEATRETMQDRIDHMHEEIQITAEQVYTVYRINKIRRQISFVLFC